MNNSLHEPLMRSLSLLKSKLAGLPFMVILLCTTSFAQAGVSTGSNPPAQPTGLAATFQPGANPLVITPGTVGLTWTASSTSGVTYNIFRSTANGFAPAAANQIATGLTAATVSYTDSTVTASVLYYYLVQAVSAGGTIDSNQASVVVPAIQSILQDVVDINAGDTGTNTIASTLTPSVYWLPDGAPNGAFTVTGGGSEGDGAPSIPAGLTDAAPLAVYQTMHNGTFTYAIPNLTPNGNYIVNLHFDEDYFQSAGSRVFNVLINGTVVLPNFDIYVAAGAAHTANVQSIPATADNTGTITVSTAAIANNPILAGIEVGNGGYPGNPQGPNPPAAPTGLTATALSAAQVNLSWNPSITANVTYSVFRSTTAGFTPSSLTQIASGLAATTYQDTAVSGNTTYYYLVQAIASDGVSNATSNQASVLTPLAGGVIENTVIAIDAGLNSSFVLPYGISNAAFPDNPNVAGSFIWQQDGTNAALNITETGGSPAANVVGITLPSGIQLPYSTEFVLQTNRTGASTWNIGNLIIGQTYIVDLFFEESYFTTPGQRVFNVTLNGIPALTNFDIENVTGGANIGTVQSFAIEAVSSTADSTGHIVVSTIAVANAPLICGIQIGTGIVGVVPEAPASLTATAVSDSEIDLSWPASVTPNVTYSVYGSTTSGFTPGAGNLLQSDVTGLSYRHINLTPETPYYYALQAVNPNNGQPITSGFATASATTMPPPCSQAPTAPGVVAATAVSSTEIDLTWAPSTAPVGCIVTYNVYRGTASEAESATALNGSPLFPSFYADTTLTAGTPYYYYAVASDSAGPSIASGEGTATTLPAGNSLWTLAWGDDFAGAANTTYDHTKWWNEVAENTGNKWGDNTIQSTSDSLQNVYLDGNGHLVEAMTYTANPAAGQTNYTSARLHSIENIGYGKIDANVQNPAGQGLGAAFWALGTDTFNFSNGTVNNPISTTNPPTAGAVPWPNCGELDMMELQSSSPAHNGSTIHGFETDTATNYEYDGLSVPMDLPAGEPNFDQAFHTITTLWGPYHVQYFMDGVQYGDVNLANLGASDIWPLMGPSDNYTINLIISSGVGGNGGTPGTTGFPADYTFDYVHYSTLTAGVPAAPTALTVSQVYSNAVQLSWTASQTPNVTYNIYESTTPNATLDLSTLIEQNASGTTFMAGALNPGTTYYFTVLASNWGGESAATSGNVVTATTSPTGNSTGILLSAGGYAVGNYLNSQYVTGGNTNYHYGAPVVIPPTVTNPAPEEVYTTERWGAAAWNIPHLIPGAVYTVRLHFSETTHTAANQRAFSVAINGNTVLTNFDIYAVTGGQFTVTTQSFQVPADGNGAIGIQTLAGTSTVAGIDENPTISAIDVTPVPPPPAAPTALIATTASSSEIDLSWTPSTTTGAEYLVFRSNASGFAPSAGNQITSTPISTSTFADTTAAAATTYYYLVEATNANGTSAASNQANATTIIAAPVAPTGLTATAISATQINLSWTASITTGVHYLIFRSTTSGFTPSAGNQLMSFGITGTTWNDKTVQPSTTYYYLVEATNVGGASAPSNQATATINSAVLTSPTPGPGTILGASNVTFQWTAGIDVSDYQLNLSAVAAGGSDLFLYKGTATSTIVPTLPANGETVYATLYSKINGVWQSNAYLYTESGTLTPAVLTSPTPGLSTILGTGNVLFQWTAGSPASDYQLSLSVIAPGGSDLFLYKGTALSTTVPTLPANGVTVYATLYSKIEGVWLSNAYVYTESGTLTPAVLTTPTPGLSTILGTSNVLFQWTAGSPASDYQLNLSAVAAGDSDLYLYKGTALTTTAPTLPANGVKVYARLYSKIDGVWLFNDYVYTEQ